MMPPEGITSVTSATEGMLGTIKKTTVNFIVNNFHDYENIYSKFFLRPGAQLFVDFGWDIADLYDPSELVKESDTVINEKLYGDGGYVTRSKGDLETVVGFVTTFDSKIRENGSVECSVEITSRNAALFSREVDDKLKNLITHSLDIEILRYAAAGYAGSGDVLKKSNKWYLSAEFKNDWKKVFQDFASKTFGKQTDNIPTEVAVELGVFYKQSENSKSLYISWGFFEDKILNRHLGFGDQERTENEPKYDSSNSFIRYNENLMKSQMYRKTLGSIQPWLYPENWDSSYNTRKEKVLTDSLDNVGTKKKYPKEFEKYNDRKEEILKLEGDILEANNRIRRSEGGFNQYSWLVSEENGRKKDREKIKKWRQEITELRSKIDRSLEFTEYIIGRTKNDKEKTRIPLRELFINVELIKEKINSSTTIVEFINSLLKTINSSSKDIFDLRTTASDYDSSNITFVDRNFMKKDTDDDEEWFNKLFMFKPGSPNSIVKTYDISFSMPKDGLQNMIAIQGAGAEGQYFPATDALDKTLAINETETDKNKSGGGKHYTSYLPEIGRHRAKQIQKEQQEEGMLLNFYNSNDAFIGGITLPENIGFDTGLIKTALEEETKKAPEEKQEEEKTEIEMATAKGLKVASSISEYYLLKATEKIRTEQLSTVMPATLSLGIYGISSLLPGDLIRVDYLPKKYRDNVFFQITKVNHNISTSTWTTELETVIRIISVKKKDSDQYFKPSAVILSKQVLSEKRPGQSNSLTDIGTLLKYISELKIIETNDNYTHIDSIFIFTASDNGDVKIPSSPAILGLSIGGYGPETVELIKGNIYYLITQHYYWTLETNKKNIKNHNRDIRQR